MKAQPRIFKGIEFVVLSDLPENQQVLLRFNSSMEWIKILIDGKILDNCIQYKEYSIWHATVYTNSVRATKSHAVPATTISKIIVEKN